MEGKLLNNPLFVIGSPRSGTTLVRIMINAHPKVLIPPENGGAIVYWYDKYKDWTKKDLQSNRVREYVDDLLSTKKIDTWHLSKQEVLSMIHELEPANYATLSACAYLAYGKKTKNKLHIWGDKNNFLIKHIDILYQLYPDAYFLYFIRDGRDVACSYKALSNKKISGQYAPTLPTNASEIANHWVNNNEAALKSFGKIPENQLLTCYYEDLVQNTKQEAKKICDFVGEPYSTQMLDYNEINDEPQEFLQWKAKITQKPDPSSVGKYKRELREPELYEFENIAGSMLKKLGY